MDPVMQQGKSKILLGAVCAVLGLIVILGVFELGLKVGYDKGRFGCGWGSRFEKMLGFPARDRDMMPPLPGTLDANGAVGVVISIHGQELILKTNDGTEKSVAILPTTEFREGMKTAELKDVAENDRVIVIGHSNDQGQIEARFIRVFDYRLNQ